VTKTLFDHIEGTVKLFDLNKKESYEISQELLDKTKLVGQLETSNRGLASSLEKANKKVEEAANDLTALTKEISMLKEKCKALNKYEKMYKDETVASLIRRLFKKIFYDG